MSLIYTNLEDLPDETIEQLYEDPPSYSDAVQNTLDNLFLKYDIPKSYTITSKNDKETTYNIWNDLRSVMACDIYLILDDSPSMNTKVVDGKNNFIGTRWDELKNMAQIAIDLASALDDDGITVHFLNKGRFDNVRSMSDVEHVFNEQLKGHTPLTVTFQEAIVSRNPAKPLLILMATDGVPTVGGPDRKLYIDTENFKNAIQSRDGGRIFVNILACSDNDDDIGYLNDIDYNDATLDTLDDYESEKKEVKKIQGMGFKYTMGIHIARFFLGGLYQHYDELDEII
jgi:hypothetical protein